MQETFRGERGVILTGTARGSAEQKATEAGTEREGLLQAFNDGWRVVQDGDWPAWSPMVRCRGFVHTRHPFPYVSDSPQLPPHFELVQLALVDSVMQEAARRARDGAEEGTLIWAMEQGDARTRRGYRWYSPPGNLYCSLILRPDFPNDRCGQLAYVAALSAGSALAGLLSPMTGLRYRWPTDLFINDLRAGQIMLAASGAHSDPYEWLTLGVMINVEQHPPNPEPEEFNSVHASGAPEVTAAQMLEYFARYFLNWINRWAEDGFEPIGRQWQIRADRVGEDIELHIGDQRLRGTFVEVDEQGRLVMTSPEQVERRISVNEYFALDRE